MKLLYKESLFLIIIIIIIIVIIIMLPETSRFASIFAFYCRGVENLKQNLFKKNLITFSQTEK